MKLHSCIAVILCLLAFAGKAQYVQPERNDTTYIFPKTVFDTAQALNALVRGHSTIKGVAFTRAKWGERSFINKPIYANKITIQLFPVTPYLLEYLDLKKHDENQKKLKFVYMTNEAYHYRLEAITNSTGEFTFPEMKPGKYYIEGILSWQETGTYNKYSGSGDDGYGRIDYYTPQSYYKNHYDKISQFVEIKNDGDVLEIKLK